MLLGQAIAQLLAATFGENAYDTIKLRRVEAHGTCAISHRLRRTMQVALSDEADYVGGRLVFATAAGFEMPHRPVGTACTHTFQVVHGVTAMESGTPYILFLCNTKGDLPVSPGASDLLEEAKNLVYLVEPTPKQSACFEMAVAVLRGASDDQLESAVVEYGRLVEVHACHCASEDLAFGAPTSAAAELAWRTHQLRPIACLAACQKLRASQHPSCKQQVLDLVAAVRRQESYMIAMLEKRSLFEDRSLIEAAVRDFFNVLCAMRHSNALEPTPLVDLVWHTHQQMPDSYHRDYLRIAGRLLDLDDNPERSSRSVGC